MAGTWEDLLDLLDETGGELEQLTDLAHEKTAAVLHADLTALDSVMKREQAAAMRLRALDRRRGELLRELGAQDTPLSALPSRCPADLRQDARETAGRLRERADLYRAAADVARTTLEVDLHEIGKRIRDGEDAPARSLTDIRA